MTIELTEKDLETLWGTEVHCLARLYIHAKKREQQGLDPNEFCLNDLHWTPDFQDLMNLKTFGYIEIPVRNIYQPGKSYPKPYIDRDNTKVKLLTYRTRV